MARIGLISDTHGLLRPEALAFLAGCDQIIHAGDIGNAGILAALSAVAPVTAVRGNNDQVAWADNVPETASLQVDDVLIHVLHDIKQLDIDPVEHGIRIVVAGHSHKPSLVDREGVLYINPGSAGPRRFKLPVSVAELVINGNDVRPRIVELTIK